MVQLKLSSAEQKVLAQVELEADLSAPEIARRAKLKTPTVQRTLQALKQKGIFDGKTAVVDTDRIGLIEFGIAIRLGAANSKILNNFYQYAKKRRSISWVAEVGGSYDLLINILAPKPQQAFDILMQIESLYPELIQEKDVCIRTQRHRYWRGYLDGRQSKAPRFSIGISMETQALSDGDSAILTALSTVTFESHRDIAQALKMPIATYLRKIKSLQQRKILLGFGYRLNLDKIGIQQFRVLISASQVSNATIKSVHDFAAKTPWVKLVTVCLGPWDFELEIDVLTQATAQEIARSIKKVIGNRDCKVLLLPIFDHKKFISFPPPE